MTKVSKIGSSAIPKKAKRVKTFGAQLRQDEERDVLRAIKISGLPQDEWIRRALLDAAKKEKILDSLRVINDE